MTISNTSVVLSGARVIDTYAYATRPKKSGEARSELTRSKLDSQVRSAKDPVVKHSAQLARTMFESMHKTSVSFEDARAFAQTVMNGTLALDTNGDEFLTAAEQKGAAGFQKSLITDAIASGNRRVFADVMAARKPLKDFVLPQVNEGKISAGSPAGKKVSLEAFANLPSGVRRDFDQFAATSKDYGYGAPSVGVLKINNSLSVYAVNGIVSDTGDETHFFTMKGHPIIGIYAGQGGGPDPFIEL